MCLWIFSLPISSGFLRFCECQVRGWWVHSFFRVWPSLFSNYDSRVGFRFFLKLGVPLRPSILIFEILIFRSFHFWFWALTSSSALEFQNLELPLWLPLLSPNLGLLLRFGLVFGVRFLRLAQASSASASASKPWLSSARVSGKHKKKNIKTNCFLQSCADLLAFSNAFTVHAEEDKFLFVSISYPPTNGVTILVHEKVDPCIFTHFTTCESFSFPRNLS